MKYYLIVETNNGKQKERFSTLCEILLERKQLRAIIPESEMTKMTTDTPFSGGSSAGETRFDDVYHTPAVSFKEDKK